MDEDSTLAMTSHFLVFKNLSRSLEMHIIIIIII